MNIITVCSLKGGTGKSTITSLLARNAAEHGLSTCVIDTDPQHSFSSLTVDNDVDMTLLDAVAGGTINECIISQVPLYERNNTALVDVIPANPALSRLREFPIIEIADCITQIAANYDVIVVDTAGIIDNITHALFSCSSKVVIPVGYGIADIAATQEFIAEMTTSYPLIDYELVINRVRMRESGRDNQYYEVIEQLGTINAIIPDSALIRNAIENRTRITSAKKYQGIIPSLNSLNSLLGAHA